MYLSFTHRQHAFHYIHLGGNFMWKDLREHSETSDFPRLDQNWGRENIFDDIFRSGRGMRLRFRSESFLPGYQTFLSKDFGYKLGILRGNKPVIPYLASILITIIFLLLCHFRAYSSDFWQSEVGFELLMLGLMIDCFGPVWSGQNIFRTKWGQKMYCFLVQGKR